MLTLGVMLGAGLVCHLIADASRIPRMLVLLAAGVLLGPSVTDAIDVPLDSMGAQLLLTLGVSFILFHGGLQLSTRILGRVGVGLGLLAVPGMVITALVAGSVAALVFDVPFSTGLLIGAVLAPTDPAILIPLFDRMGLRQKVEQTAIAESALNDSTGAVLALVFAGVVLTGDASVTQPAIDFVEDLGISTALGIGFGILLSLVVSNRRAGIWQESAAIAVVAVVAVGYFSIDSAGGSGYLGAFLAGLDRGQHGPAPARHAHDARTGHARPRRHRDRDRRDPRLHHRWGEPALGRHGRQLLAGTCGRRRSHPPRATADRPRVLASRPARCLDETGDRLPVLDA